MRWLRGWLDALRLRLFGPGEITAPEQPDMVAAIQCLHRYPGGGSAWGPCIRVQKGTAVAYYRKCLRGCGATAKC